MALGIDLGGAVTAAVGMGLGAIGQKARDERQLKQQEKLQNLQVRGNKQMADYQQSLQMDMWNKTNYGAQKQHLEAAGLNAGLMYGMSGGGGATTGGGGGAGVSGGQAANSAQQAQEQIGMGMQLAQLKLMNAQADKTNAETEKLKGVDTEQVKAQTGLLNTTNSLKVVEQHVAENTKNDAIGRIVADAEKAMFEARSSEVNADVAKQTKEVRIEQIRADLQSTQQSIENAKKAGNLMDAETAIKGFEANLAKQGISPNSPWYIKIVTGLLESVGLGITKGTEQVKQAIK